MSDFAEDEIVTNTLTPGVEEPLDPDAALALVEQEVGRDPLSDLQASEQGAVAGQDVTITPVDTTPVGRSWAFDFTANRFLAEGGGFNPVGTRRLETLRYWIIKVLHTDRGAHPIHSDDYGMEGWADLIGQPLAIHEDMEQRVSDALTFHPRIIAVTDFESTISDDDDDIVEISFSVVLDDDETLTFEDLRLAR